MINDILDYSHISNGSLRLKFEEFSLVEMIKDVSKLIKFQAKRKGLIFYFKNQIENDDQKEGKIISDQNRLKQVILNLLGNALKFTQRGSIGVTLSCSACEEKEERKYLVQVEDTGCGIAPEDKPRLFQLFGKLENVDSIKFNETGVGLGLAISQNLIKLMNNNRSGEEIKVNSVVGQGSCFYFNIFSQENFRTSHSLEIPSERSFREEELFLLKIGENQEETGFSSECKLPAENKQMKILVVDDDQINIMVMNAYLKALEFCVFDCVFNGQQALEKIQTRAATQYFYDIIIMDCNMPIMDGFQATRRIRKMIKDGSLPSDVIIIASTANASPTDYENCFLAGMNDYISKPFSKEVLLAMLSKWMARKGKT